MHRRQFLQLALLGGAAALPALDGRAQPAGAVTELRVGYQKNGVLVIARQQAVLERLLNPRGIGVKWTEFPAGPPLLEAANAGSIDVGYTGDTPPIFAQAAGAAIVYIAGQPITNGQGILVKDESSIRALADLRGRRIGFTKGSSAHNITIMALEKAGLAYGDVTPVYLSPPDAAAAFARGSIDAWAIWDPYFAIGERNGGRILVHSIEVGRSNSFFIGGRGFATRHGGLVRDVVQALAEAARWAEAHRDRVAQAMADVTGVDLGIQTIAANRSSFAVGELTGDIIATQQAVADRFYRLGLIPRPVTVRDAVWSAPQS
jgi:sulfonate transport system substrate-binding protein